MDVFTVSRYYIIHCIQYTDIELSVRNHRNYVCHIIYVFEYTEIFLYVVMK